VGFTVGVWRSEPLGTSVANSLIRELPERVAEAKDLGAERQPIRCEETMADDMRREGVNDKLKGLGKEIEGRARNAAGGLRGDSREQIKGKAQEVKGKVQRRIGEAESDTARDRNVEDLDVED